MKTVFKIAMTAGIALLMTGPLLAEEIADLSLAEPEGMFSVTPILEQSCLAVQIPLSEKQALAGLRWYSSDDQVVFAKLLVAAGLQGSPPLYEDGVAMVTSVGGARDSWNELKLSEPLASETDVLYAIFQLPDGQDLAEDRVPQLGFKQADDPSIVYLSSDGLEWVQLQAECQVLVEPVLTDRAPGTLTLTATLPSKAKESEVQYIPLRTGLTNPYPNPFNPMTQIEFALAKPGKVDLEVFDLRGCLVNRLASGFYPAGRYVVEWNGVNDQDVPLASGVYLIRLKTPEGQFNRRAVLLK